MRPGRTAPEDGKKRPKGRPQANHEAEQSQSAKKQAPRRPEYRRPGQTYAQHRSPFHDR